MDDHAKSVLILWGPLQSNVLTPCKDNRVYFPNTRTIITIPVIIPNVFGEYVTINENTLHIRPKNM